MLLRTGVVRAPLLIALFATGCRSFWREPPSMPLVATLDRSRGLSTGDDDIAAQALPGSPVSWCACRSGVALDVAEDRAVSAARAERTGWDEATDDQYLAV